jgi:L-ascorbate metabolism protein UlaG (beta-lactamase superfamily)
MGQLTFHGHATFELALSDGTRLLIDPFLTGNPAAVVGLEHFDEGVDFLLLTHGHSDHVADAWNIIDRTGCTVISSVEICTYVNDVLGHAETHPMSIGGGYDFPFGRVEMTPALHGGRLDAPGGDGYTCPPAGFLLEVDGTGVYLAGDTGLTRDMELLRGRVDMAMLPIGDNFTMGPRDAARAVEMIGPNIVVPFHYNTWDVINQDPAEFAELVGESAEVRALEAGQSLEF